MSNALPIAYNSSSVTVLQTTVLSIMNQLWSSQDRVAAIL